MVLTPVVRRVVALNLHMQVNCMKRSSKSKFCPSLDREIEKAVQVLVSAGIEAFDCFQGGKRQASPEPAIRFYGGDTEGFLALAAALEAGLNVSELRRTRTINARHSTGPAWELRLSPSQNQVAEPQQPVRRQLFLNPASPDRPQQPSWPDVCEKSTSA